METLHITDVSQLKELAEKAISHLQERIHDKVASVLALSGDLGAGKTAFVKVLAQKLGIDDVVNSPTYVIMKRYEVGDTGAKKALPFSHLCHIDAYRIEEIDEMRPLRFAEVLEDPNTLVCIEWAERIKELLPLHTVYMDFKQAGETRIVTFS